MLHPSRIWNKSVFGYSEGEPDQAYTRLSGISVPMNIKIKVGQEVRGPYSSEQLKEELTARRVGLADLGCRGDSEGWVPLAHMPEVIDVLLPATMREGSPLKGDPQIAQPPLLPDQQATVSSQKTDSDQSIPTEEDLALFVGPNKDYYLARWKARAHSRVFSWNWPAFLLGIAWIGYRKMYLAGSIWIGLSLLIGIIAGLLDPYRKFSPIVWVMLLVFTGLLGNYAYKIHAARTIRRRRRIDQHAPTATIIRAGGTSVVGGVLFALCSCAVFGFLDTWPAPQIRNDSGVTTEATVTPEQIAARLRESTVKILGEFDEGHVFHDVERWAGTGIIWCRNKDKYWILSNCHVIGFWKIYEYDGIGPAKINRYTLWVRMPDGTEAPATQVKVNSFLKDYAFIAVNSGGSFPELRHCQPNPRQGQKVFAMGHPMGLDYTFTSGVVSGFRPHISDLGKRYALIQTDASINSGNSGGPLVDEFGNLLGLNTMVRSDAQGLNFAIAISAITDSIKNEEWIDFPLSPNDIGPFVRKLKASY